MKNFIKTLSYMAIFTTTIITTACQKELSDKKPDSLTKQMLINKTWEIDEVVIVEDGKAEVQYKKGAINNKEDYAKARLIFNTDNSYAGTDEEGDPDTGTYKILENEKKIEMTPSDMLPLFLEEINITANEFSYKMMQTPELYIQFTLKPIP